MFLVCQSLTFVLVFWLVLSVMNVTSLSYWCLSLIFWVKKNTTNIITTCIFLLNPMLQSLSHRAPMNVKLLMNWSSREILIHRLWCGEVLLSYSNFINMWLSENLPSFASLLAQSIFSLFFYIISQGLLRSETRPSQIYTPRKPHDFSEKHLKHKLI